MRHKLRTLSLAALGILTAAFALLILTANKSAPLPPLPNPNGYDDFVTAGNLVSDRTAMPYEMEREALSEFVSTNAEPLRLARLGLSRICSVPTAEVLTNFHGRINDLMAIKWVAQLLAGEGRLAEMEGRTNDAARCYVDDIRLGNEVSRGGLMIHRLVGIACETTGCERLAKLVPNLKPEEARPLIAELERANKTAVTWAEVRKLEKVFKRDQMFKRINPLAWIQEWWQTWSLNKRAKQKHDRSDVRVRLIATELAVRCYQSDLGRPPATLKGLVPKYLQRVPQDPFSVGPFVYRVNGNVWLLYSIGPNGVDDGGAPASRGPSGPAMNGDLFFDTP